MLKEGFKASQRPCNISDSNKMRRFIEPSSNGNIIIPVLRRFSKTLQNKLEDFRKFLEGFPDVSRGFWGIY